MHTKLVQLPVVHMMLTQHSLFLPTMLTSEEEENLDSQVKGDPTLCPPSSVAAVIFRFLPASCDLFSECSNGISVSVKSRVQAYSCLQSDTEVATCLEGFVWFMEVLWEIMWPCHELLLKVWELGAVGRDGKTSVDICPARTGLAL